MSEDTYRSISGRQRLKIVAITLATVVALWALLLLRPGAHVRRFPDTPRPTCAQGQTTDCVGGQANVSLVAAEPASAASAH